MNKLVIGMVIVELIINMALYNINEQKEDFINKQSHKIELQRNYVNDLEYENNNNDVKSEKLKKEHEQLENKYDQLKKEHQQLENKYQKVTSSNQS